MMQALARLGHEVALLTAAPASAEAVKGLDLAFCETLDRGAPPELTRLQARFLSYWGVEASRLSGVRQDATAWRADVVVAVGLNALPYLADITKAERVWYAADEAAWHHLSQLCLSRPSTWRHFSQAAINGLYERSFAGCVDRAWVVSETERQAMRWIAGIRNVDVVANGVDDDHFRPLDVPQHPRSCVFWGRLDFGPNLQALAWFCRKIWPALRRRVPDARFTIYGRCPTEAARALVRADGIELVPDLPDLRGAVARHQVVVLPFISGGGIKNKLLEAAALGKAIVCTPRACGGLRSDSALPLCIVRRPSDWVEAIERMWLRSPERERLGAEAREWVQTHHTWETAARAALVGLTASKLPIDEDEFVAA
jgi:glycosyltransferase involved in cell wall biosynthesis